MLGSFSCSRSLPAGRGAASPRTGGALGCDKLIWQLIAAVNSALRRDRDLSIKAQTFHSLLIMQSIKSNWGERGKKKEKRFIFLVTASELIRIAYYKSSVCYVVLAHETEKLEFRKVSCPT